MGEFSLTHILLVGVIFIIFFGPSRLPQLGQSLGKAIRGFKQGLNEIDIDSKDVENTSHQAEQQRPTQLTNQQTTQHATQQQAEVKVKDTLNHNS